MLGGQHPDAVEWLTVVGRAGIADLAEFHRMTPGSGLEGFQPTIVSDDPSDIAGVRKIDRIAGITPTGGPHGGR